MAIPENFIYFNFTKKLDEITETDEIQCPNCHSHSIANTWTDEHIECDVCGDHPAIICPSCGDCHDHVYSDKFKIKENNGKK